MTQRTQNLSRGFTVIEITIAVFLLGVIAAFAAPRISNSMREYRLNNSMHQIIDLMNRAKTQAMSNNTRATMRVDTANNRFGLVVYDANNNEVRTDYIPLPQGVTFATPPSVTPPMTNVQTTYPVSFPLQSGSSTVYQQDFTSRGFPAVSNAGAINVIYIGNSQTYRAITISSVGGVRTWVWKNSSWSNTRQ
jgi:prepilin-type N-terminal cleavage/methylation domain-containing protein